MRKLIIALLFAVGTQAQTTVPSLKIQNTPVVLNDTTAVDILVRQKTGAANQIGIVRKITWPYLISLVSASVGGQDLQSVGNVGSSMSVPTAITLQKTDNLGNAQSQLTLSETAGQITFGQNRIEVTDDGVKFVNDAAESFVLPNKPPGTYTLATADEVGTQNLAQILAEGNTAENDIILQNEHHLRLEGSDPVTKYAELRWIDGFGIASTTNEFLFNDKNMVRSVGGLPANLEGDVPLGALADSLSGNFIPIGGTITGQPVTGDVELIESVKIKSANLNRYFSFGDEGDVRIYNDEVVQNNTAYFRSVNTEFSILYDGFITSYRFDPLNIIVASGHADFKGVEGASDYSEIDPTNKLIYAQRQYVDDAIAASGSGTVTSVTGDTTGGINVATGTTTPAITASTASGTQRGTTKLYNNVVGTNTDGAPDQSSVKTALDLKANDNTVVHLAGSETVTGAKTFSATTLTADVNPINSNTYTLGTVSNYYASAGIGMVNSNIIQARTTAGLFFRNSSGSTYGSMSNTGTWNFLSATVTNAPVNPTDVVRLSDLQAAGSGYVAKTAAYTLTAADHVVDLTTGTAIFTLPTAVGAAGKQYVVKNSGTGALTVNTTSTQTIDGALTKPFPAQYSGMRVVSDGANWKIIGLF